MWVVEKKRSLLIYQVGGRSLIYSLYSTRILECYQEGMGRIRLRVREFAQEKGWNLTEVSKRTGIPYTTIITYANSSGMATVDYTALDKMARAFDIAIEDLVEILEE